MDHQPLAPHQPMMTHVFHHQHLLNIDCVLGPAPRIGRGGALSSRGDRLLRTQAGRQQGQEGTPLGRPCEEATGKGKQEGLEAEQESTPLGLAAGEQHVRQGTAGVQARGRNIPWVSRSPPLAGPVLPSLQARLLPSASPAPHWVSPVSVPQDCPARFPRGPGSSLPSASPSPWNSKLLAGTVPLGSPPQLWGPGDRSAEVPWGAQGRVPPPQSQERGSLKVEQGRGGQAWTPPSCHQGSPGPHRQGSCPLGSRAL